MYRFSFKEGLPVAKHGNKLIRITQNNNIDDDIEDEIEEMVEDLYTDSRKISKDDYEELIESLKTEVKPIHKKLHHLYDKLLLEVNKKRGRELNFYDNKLTQYPLKNREVIYICGKSGSGKSTACAEYIYAFQKRFPDSDVIIISTILKDPALQGLRIMKVNLDIMKNDPIDIDDLKDNSLIVFDDTESIKDKNIKKNVTELMDQILTRGRHKNCYCLITNHLINDYKKTRQIINELTKIILFPCGSSQGNIDYFLEKHLGFDKDKRQEVKKLKSRYIIISNVVPQYVMCSNKIFLV